MSTYLETEQLSSLLSTLGYPVPITQASFRTPNFPLMASILTFLLRPFANVPRNIATSDDRVYFLTSCVNSSATKLNCPLNPIRLYQANGSTVLELLRLAQCISYGIDNNLYRSAEPGDSGALEDLTALTGLSNISSRGVSNDAESLQEAAQGLHALSVELVSESSAFLATLRQAQGAGVLGQLSDSLATPCSSSAVQNSVSNHTKALQTEFDTVSAEVSAAKSEYERLVGAHRQRLNDLSYTLERIKSLKNTKPTFAKDLDKLNSELMTLNAEYIDRMRSYAYYMNELRKTDKEEALRNKEREARLFSIREKTRKEELSMLTGANGNALITSDRVGGVSQRQQKDSDKPQEQSRQQEQAAEVKNINIYESNLNGIYGDDDDVLGIDDADVGDFENIIDVADIGSDPDGEYTFESVNDEQ